MKAGKWMSLCVSLALVPFSAAAADEDFYDFGGMYGGGFANGSQIDYPNPATGAASCPSGYTPHQVFGTANVDWFAFLCTRPHASGRAPLYDFGGMVGASASDANGALPWSSDTFYFLNPLTHAPSCPKGYTRQAVLGTQGVDKELYYCWRSHTGAGVRMRFGGMSGDALPQPYPNPARPPGSPQFNDCPSGYKRYTAFGTPNLDYTFYYCGIAQNPLLESAGPGSLGIGEPVVSNAVNLSPTDSRAAEVAHLDQQLADIKSLRPRVFRMWMLSSDMLVNESTTGINIDLYRRAVQSLHASGITIVGMDNSFPQWMTGFPPDASAGVWVVPCRGTAAYTQFLNRYEATWLTMASEFPQIKHWEIANETNGDNLMKPPGAGPAACAMGKTQFTLQDRADITTDLMFRAHRAIKLANPQALVFMPPPSPLDDHVNLMRIYDFIKMLYENIRSGQFGSPSARDFFDGAAWHPYIFRDANDASWVVPNNRIHGLLAEYNDGNIPVLLSEVGNSTYGRDPNVIDDWFSNTVKETRGESMPWVTYLIWFRAFDDPRANWGNIEEEKRYGILKGDLAPAPTVRTRSPTAARFCEMQRCDSPE